ncbi:MAG: hypothetical protein Q8N03_07955 [Ignavibacteria bacterium]|nr:hypothetical protein [Ignavibacteria bacterium]
MNSKGILRNQKFILIAFILFLTLLIATIHNLFFNEGTDSNSKNIDSNKEYFSQIDKLQQENTQLKTELDSLKRTDLYYYQSGITSFDSAHKNNSLKEIEKSKKSFEDLLKKFPNSSYLSESKLKLKELAILKDKIEKYNSTVSQIYSFAEAQEYKKALQLLSKSKQLLNPDEFEELKKLIEKQRDKPIIVSIRDLLSESKKYEGKIVEVSSLRAISNDVQRKYFSTYKSTGIGRLDFDTDLGIKVYYDKASNRDELIYLTGDNNPEMTVIGKFVYYSFFGSYIDAKEIKY